LALTKAIAIATASTKKDFDNMIVQCDVARVDICSL
jgi:hypothetical protein